MTHIGFTKNRDQNDHEWFSYPIIAILRTQS